MALTRLPIQPAVIKWARETAGLDTATAAARIGVKPDKVESWEDGSLAPTIKPDQRYGRRIRSPARCIVHAGPLVEGDVTRELPDFRRQEVRAHTVSRGLQKAMMRAHRQRDALRDVAEDLELPDTVITPQFSLDQRRTADNLGDQLRLALRMDELAKSILLQPDMLLRGLVRRAEELNVTVIQVQRVEVSEMRGFSLGDGRCPIIALNGADWPRGKVYTLLHELVHVGFRSNGLCDLQATQDLVLERQCDAVAAAALMPVAMFREVLDSMPSRPITQDMARVIGNEFG